MIPTGIKNAILVSVLMMYDNISHTRSGNFDLKIIKFTEIFKFILKGIESVNFYLKSNQLKKV